MKKLMFVLVLLISITSCSLQKKLNNAKHLIEDHGGFVLLENDSLAGTCAEKYPCVTTEREVTDSGWVVLGRENQAVIDSLKKANDRLKEILKNPPVITDSASCIKAVQYYQARIAEYAGTVAGLTAQIKNSSTEYRQRTEKLTVESSAKLAAKDVIIKRQYDELKTLTIQSALVQQKLVLADDNIADYKKNEKSLVYVLGLLWSILIWWIIGAAVLFGLYKFRKLIPFLKWLP
jgi:hypothetical protein